MTKLEKYKAEFEKLKEEHNSGEKLKLSNDEIMARFAILQTELQFEMITALQIIAKQNKKIESGLKEINGEPIRFEIPGENENDADNGENN